MLQATESTHGIESWNETIFSFDLERLDGGSAKEIIEETLEAFDPYEPGSCGQFSCSGYWGAF